MLITEREFEEKGSRDLIPLECEYCHERFEKPKNSVYMGRKKVSGHTFQFCSLKCAGLCRTEKNTKLVKCGRCGIQIRRKNNDIKRFKNVFCSQSCAASYHNAHKEFGTRRSKLEKWIEGQLIKQYPNLEIHYNKTDTINAELDIYIPSLKLAFELNGIFHYEPVFGEDKLNKIKNNDQRKFQACAEKGISLCIIDTHNTRYLKIERDKRFLDIITETIFAHKSL